MPDNSIRKQIKVEEKLKRYEKLGFLGEGQFATVYKAKDLQTNEIVAVKKIKLGTRDEARDGINRTALREIKLMQEVNHENLLGLLDVFGHKSNVSLVFDFMASDMEVIIRDPEIMLTPANIKAYLIQTLKGLEFLHLHWILHRDLKPNNLLVNSNGILKIADFGLARFYGSPNRAYSHQVVTRWYRAPELLYGSRFYGAGIDVWSVGCILAEMLIRRPFFPGDSDLDQLTRIFNVLGSPQTAGWSNVELLPDYVDFSDTVSNFTFPDLFPAASDSLLQVIQTVLALDPIKRLSCTQLLKMKYFSDSPAPTPGPELPLPEPSEKKKEDKTTLLKRKILEESGVGESLAKKLHF